MIKFDRYAHVGDFLNFYASFFNDEDILKILKDGVLSEDNAKSLSLFIWKMTDQMREDCESGTEVLGGTDNSEMLPDVHYEISSYLSDLGFESIWEKISDEA